MNIKPTVASLALFFSIPCFSQTKPVTRPAPPGGFVTPPLRRDVPGMRITLSTGQLYLPDFFHPDRDHSTQLVIWSLGGAWISEQNFYDARKNAGLLTLNGAALKAGFPTAEKFQSLVDETNAAIEKQFPDATPITKICLGSFSGGYTAVRDILRLRQFDDMITDVVLADSLYAPHLKDHPNQLDASAMKPFLDFAARAANGQATFIFSQLYPPDEKYRGNTTTLAASYLIDHLKIPRIPTTSPTTNSAGARLLYRADLQNVHILGYAGMTNQDHFNHFYASADLLKQTSLSPAP